MRSFIIGAVAVVVGIVGPARADEEKVALDKVPKAVMDAAKKRFPDAKFTDASKEDENGKTTYELTFKDGGKNVDVTLTPEGVLTLIEKEVDAKDVPKAVSDGIDAKYPKASWKMIEAVIKVKDGKEELDYYEYHGTTADKKGIEVEIAPDGKIKKTEEKKDDK